MAPQPFELPRNPPENGAPPRDRPLQSFAGPLADVGWLHDPADRPGLSRREQPQVPLEAEVGDDAVRLVSRVDPVAAQMGVKGARPGVDPPRVADGDRADEADAVRSERRAHGGAEQEVSPPAADSLAEGPARPFERSPREEGAMISTVDTRMIPLPALGLFRNGQAESESAVSAG